MKTKPWRLLLPALMPSWRFFDTIGPSPRIEFRVWQRETEVSSWREFLPPPSSLSLLQMGLRLLWNPRRNERLFLTRCAERVLEGETGFPLGFIESTLTHTCGQDAQTQHFQYRIVALYADVTGIERSTAYESPRRELSR